LPVLTSILQGAAAGFAIAIPVGAIGVLIVERGIRFGFREAFVAGLGVATADLVYASIAAGAGVAVSEIIEPALRPLRWAAVVVLVAVAIQILLRGSERTVTPPARAGGRRSYLLFLGLTIVNPATMVYFVSLIVGLEVASTSAVEKVAFALAAGAASAVWQSTLAGIATVAGTRLGTGFQRASSIAGAVVILALALQTASRI
jgi:threonine/homoserine/homoserine lactone efflux protein